MPSLRRKVRNLIPHLTPEKVVLRIPVHRTWIKAWWAASEFFLEISTGLIHCRKEGCIGKYAPRGNLHPWNIAWGRSPRALSRAEGGHIFQFFPTRGSVYKIVLHVIIHWREEGCIGKYAPWDNLHPKARDIARGQSRGPRSANSRGESILQLIPTRGNVLPFIFPERECIGNYPSNSRYVLTVYNFNTLPLYKK